MQLSSKAEAKITNDKLKEVLSAADADTIINGHETELNIYFDFKPGIPEDVTGPAFVVAMAEATSAHYQRVQTACESLGISTHTGELSPLFWMDTVLYSPASIRADQLAALIEHDLVTGVEKNDEIYSEYGETEAKPAPLTVDEMKELNAHIRDSFQQRLIAAEVATSIHYKSENEADGMSLTLVHFENEVPQDLKAAIIESSNDYAQEKFGKSFSADDVETLQARRASALGAQR